MIINPLDAHDRLNVFKSQSDDIANCCQNIVNQRPFGSHKFYIFAHKREIGLDERISMYNQDLTASLTDPANHKRRWFDLKEVPTARIIWQPRLTKPKAQTNSMLFKADPSSDNIKIIWIIPPRELWGQYAKDKLTGDKLISECIHDFEHNRIKLEMPDDDDLNDDQVDAVYREIKIQANLNKTKSKQFVPLIC